MIIKRPTRVIFIKIKNCLVYMTEVDKILISKKEFYGKKKAHLKTFLDIMMMMLLDVYV